MIKEKKKEKNKKKETVRREGRWHNTYKFSPAAKYFEKHGVYTHAIYKSQDWFDFWREEKRRIIEGFYVGGTKITGEHYHFLNYCPIMKLDKDSISEESDSAVKIKGFPDFRDGDYTFYWTREIARVGIFKGMDKPKPKKNIIKKAKLLEKKLYLLVTIEGESLLGGKNSVNAKSRRKGYSLKAGGIGTRNFFFFKNSLTIFNAFDKKYLYPDGVYNLTTSFINFMNEHTAFTTPSEKINKQGHIKASYEVVLNGATIEKGYMSQIMALTARNKTGVNRGRDAKDIYVEEAGESEKPGLLRELLSKSEDSVKAGNFKTGHISLTGTSGEMDKGSIDLSIIHENPKVFDMLAIYNHWDDPSMNTLCGFFHPFQWNLEGYYDKHGNSDIEGALKDEREAIEKLEKNGATSSQILKRQQERPTKPSEAFTQISSNSFPVAELRARLAYVKANPQGLNVDFYREDGVVKIKPVFDKHRVRINSYIDLPKDLRGIPVIYEHPVLRAPRGLYKIGYDPIRQDSGTSLAAIVVYKTVLIGDFTHSVIVAEYIGRLESPDDIDRLAEYFADYYNTTIMHENEVPGVKNFFRRIKRLYLLAKQPDAVISNSIKSTKVKRIYGCHMVGPLKIAGERYIKDWLIMKVDHDNNGLPIRALEKINSARLLEELIYYSVAGNYDMVSALIMCLFQVQEEELETVHKRTKSDNIRSEFKSMIKNLYKR